ncbi:hypothetical protein Tco_1159701, partial [Tanacetum coccineum]
MGRWEWVGVSCGEYLGGGLELKTGGEGGLILAVNWL